MEAFLSDKISESILETCIKYCPIALKDPSNYEARSNLMWASSLALNGLCGSGKSGTWTCHPIEHELSAFYDITHGIGLAIITPNWMKYILSEKSDDKFDLANKAIEATYNFFSSLRNSYESWKIRYR